MKKHHLFAFYCALLVPVGSLAGFGVGQFIDSLAVLVVVGTVLGLAASYLLQRQAAPDEMP